MKTQRIAAAAYVPPCQPIAPSTGTRIMWRSGRPSPTQMSRHRSDHLAREGDRVLLIDRAHVSKRPISDPILWPHGAEIIGPIWGLLNRGVRVPAGRPRHLISDGPVRS